MKNFLTKKKELIPNAKNIVVCDNMTRYLKSTDHRFCCAYFLDETRSTKARFVTAAGLSEIKNRIESEC